MTAGCPISARCWQRRATTALSFPQSPLRCCGSSTTVEATAFKPWEQAARKTGASAPGFSSRQVRPSDRGRRCILLSSGRLPPLGLFSSEYNGRSRRRASRRSGYQARMSADKTILKVHDSREQEQATLRYWQSLPMGERLTAVWDASEAAYSFAAAFKGDSPDYDARRLARTLTRVERPRR